MPYVIELRDDRAEIRLPEGCPYCSSREADDSIESRYSKPLAVLPAPIMVFVSREATFRFPACASCARQVRVLGKLAPYIALVPAAALVAALFSSWDRIDLFIYAAIACACMAGVMLCIRQWRMWRFRVGYQGGTHTLIYAAARGYAEEFARLNHVPMRFRWVVFRWY